MRPRALLALLAAALLCGAPAPSSPVLSAVAQAPAASRVDAARLVADLDALASPEMQGRLTGTDGNRRAQVLIRERFTQLTLAPLNGSFEQRFPFARSRGSAKQEVPDATNLMGLLPGTDGSRYVLVTAHYDHLGLRNGRIYYGADDNASGVAAMLEVARVLSARPPPASVLFVAFDAEEHGLQGSKYFVAHPPIDLSRVTAVLNLDMVGRGDANVLYVAGTSHYPALKPAVDAAAKGRSIEVRFGHDRPGPGPLGAEDDWTTQSDHGSFHAAHVPFLYFGVENHADYHRPTDTADKIPRRFFAEATELAISTVLNMADKPAREPAALPDRGSAAAAGSLSSEEQAIVGAVDRDNAEALALLERVVNINSGSMNFAGVREVGKVFEEKFERLGFTTRWIDGAPFNRAGHLVAERRGTGPHVLLIGHLDTVFEPDSPFQRFERVDGTTARGPGIIDMKGGDVVMVQALEALRAAGVLDALQLTVVLTGDEELTGEPLSAAREALIAAAGNADVAIGFEDGPGDPKTAVIARRGTTGWQLRVKAKPAHSSQIFRKDIGAGAIYEAARILNSFREELAGEEHLTFNPGVILGGTSVDFDPAHARGTASGKENVVAEHTTVMGDLRTLSAAQLERAKQRMRAIVDKSLPFAQAAITFDEGYPPLAPTDGNRRLLALYDRASRDIGAGPVTAVSPDRAGAADVSFVAGHVKMILDGVGLMGHSDHTPQETADLTTLPSQTKRAAILLYRISKGVHLRSPD